MNIVKVSAVLSPFLQHFFSGSSSAIPPLVVFSDLDDATETLPELDMELAPRTQSKAVGFFVWAFCLVVSSCFKLLVPGCLVLVLVPALDAFRADC